MSNNGDFYTGYAAGQGANRKQVDTQSFVDEGVNAGRTQEHDTQSWYVQRLMRHLNARASQKNALMEALKKYAPNHPYLNETVVPNKFSELSNINMLEMEKIYQQVMNNADPDESSRLLALEMGGGITTEGDLAMAADGVAFVADDVPKEIEDNLQKVFSNLDPSPSSRQERQNEIWRAKQQKEHPKALAVVTFLQNHFG